MAMSLPLDGLAAAHAALLHLGDHDALAAHAGAHRGLAAGAHFTAHELAVRSLPSHSKMKSGALFAASAVAISPPTALSGWLRDSALD
jgi:hypothetical protein